MHTCVRVSVSACAPRIYQQQVAEGKSNGAGEGGEVVRNSLQINQKSVEFKKGHSSLSPPTLMFAKESDCCWYVRVVVFFILDCVSYTRIFLFKVVTVRRPQKMLVAWITQASHSCLSRCRSQDPRPNRLFNSQIRFSSLILFPLSTSHPLTAATWQDFPLIDHRNLTDMFLSWLPTRCQVVHRNLTNLGSLHITATRSQQPTPCMRVHVIHICIHTHTYIYAYGGVSNKHISATQGAHLATTFPKLSATLLPRHHP